MKLRVSRGVWIMAVLGVSGIAVVVALGGTTWAEVGRQGWLWSAVAVAALLHEGGHLLAARLLGVRVRGLRPDFFGARLELEGMLSYGRESGVAAGGPLVNLLSAVAFCPSAGEGETWVTWFVGASLALGLVNLLPVESLDGGRILACLLARWRGDAVSVRVTQVTTGLCLGLSWLLSAYALLRAEQMLSVFLFSLCLLIRGMGKS